MTTKRVEASASDLPGTAGTIYPNMTITSAGTVGANFIVRVEYDDTQPTWALEAALMRVKERIIKNEQ